MRFVSLFAGVGGFDLGFELAGMECVGQVEIDKNARKVLDRNWPDVPKHDDVTTAKEWASDIGLIGGVDIVCGGFPCQDVSKAGKRAGLAGKRTGLFWDALSFATHVEAEWFVLENVPGLLSSNNGWDFGVVITAMADAGYRHIEWRVLDSQFFGVAQRRRRLFIVGSLGKRSGRAVLVESPGMSGDFEQVNAQRQKVAGTLGGGSGNRGLSPDTDRMTFIPWTKARRAMNPEDHETWVEGFVSPTLNAFDNATEVRATVINTCNVGVRRLTPRECERLQGFPDDWTFGADSHRYKQMGNAVTVNVAEYLGNLILESVDV